VKNSSNLIKSVKELVARARLPNYLHRFGPKTYRTWQHVITLVLRAETQLGFRRAARLLCSLEVVVPTYSATCKFVARLPMSTWQRLFAATNTIVAGIIAVDSTGLSRTNPSYHYLKRIEQPFPVGKPVKLSIAVDTKTKRVLAARIRALPAHDVRDVPYLLKRVPQSVRILLGDKGYDSEPLHKLCRKRGIISIVPVRARCRTGRHRKRLRDYFPQKLYNQRSLAETAFSVLKRCYGSSVRCRTARTQRAEVFCRLIHYNLFRLLNRLFQRSPKQVVGFY